MQKKDSRSQCNCFIQQSAGCSCGKSRTKNERLNVILNTGIEPVTLGLLDPRSTDWANQVKGEAVTPPCIEVVIGNEIFLIYISFVMILGAMSMLSMSCILCWPFVYNKKNKSSYSNNNWNKYTILVPIEERNYCYSIIIGYYRMLLLYIGSKHSRVQVVWSCEYTWGTSSSASILKSSVSTTCNT